MKFNLRTILASAAIFFIAGCSDKDYSLGELTAPTNIVINTEIKGVDATHPDGDGSGDVKISVKADNAISYKVDVDASNATNLVSIPGQSITNTYSNSVPGVYSYVITAVAYGRGGVSSTATKTIHLILQLLPILQAAVQKHG